MFSDFAHDCFVISIVFNSFNRFEEKKEKKFNEIENKRKISFYQNAEGKIRREKYNAQYFQTKNRVLLT